MLDLKQQRVLITGGAGFLGRHVCEKLADRCAEMWAPSSDEFNCLSLWDCDRAICGRDIVIHLAALCGGIGKNQAMPADMFAHNMQMGMNLIDACAKRKAKLVLIGTVCSYPANTPVPFKESDLWNGYPEETNAPYGIAKRALFEMARAYHKQYGLKCACLLPANLYGPGDNFDLETSHVIPAMIRKLAAAKAVDAPWATFWGTGMATRDFLYVEDAADAIIRAVECVDSPEPINIGTGREISIKAVCRMIGSLLNYQCNEIWNADAPDGQLRRCLDTSRAKELLNWQATADLETGLRKTIDWYLEHRKEAVPA